MPQNDTNTVQDTSNKDNGYLASFIPLVRSIAKHFVRPHLPIEELVAVGSVGLVEAYESYQSDVSTKFSTYAYWKIFYRLQHHVQKMGRIVPLSESREMRVAQRKTKAVRRGIEQKQGSAASQEQIANELLVSVDTVARVEQVSALVDVPLRTENTEIGVDLSSSIPSPEQLVTDREITEFRDKALLAAINQLSRQAQDIIFAYYLEEQPDALKAMASFYHVSYERIRQIRNQSLLHMRRSLKTYRGIVS